MRVACVQLAGQELAGPADRRDAALAVLADVPPVDLIVLPELWPVGFFHFDEYAAGAESAGAGPAGSSPTADLITALARERSCWVHGGSVVERAGDGLYNTSLVADPTGEIVLRYRKHHLFGYQSRESELLRPGSELPTADLGGLIAGASTCYDLRFPELFRRQLDAGAQLLLVTSAWPAARLEHWRLLTRARAVENLSYLIACNTAGTDAGTAMAGHSVVVDPFGTVVAEAGVEPGVLLAEIDPQLPTKLRAEYPFLTDRRD